MNKKYIVPCIVMLMSFFATACKDTTLPVSSKPYLELVGSSPAAMRYGSPKDTLIIKYNFTDDQNLQNCLFNLTFHFDKGGDSITVNNIQFPNNIDDNMVDSKRGITGVGYIILPAPFINFPDTNVAKKNIPSLVNCSFYLIDAQGNYSNTLVTNKFYIDYP